MCPSSIVLPMKTPRNAKNLESDDKFSAQKCPKNAKRTKSSVACVVSI